MEQALTPRMEIVQLPRQGLGFPDVCPCCLQPADFELSLSRTKTYPLLIATVYETETLQVPYCTACCAHVLWHEEWGMAGTLLRALVVTILTSFLALIVAGFVWIFVRHAAVLAIAVVPGIWAGIVSLRRRLRGRPASPVDAAHARKACALAFLGGDREHIFLGVHSAIFLRTLIQTTPGAQVVPGGMPGQPSRALVIAALILIVLFVVLIALGYMDVGTR